MHSRSSRSQTPAAVQRPGDPLDPVRARQGKHALFIVLIGSLMLYFGVAVLAFGPNGAGLGLMNRVLGWDSPVLAIVPFLLLFWTPMFVLRCLPRRPERSFLCGAQDALDPTRNPNWHLTLPSSEAVARRMRRLRTGASVVAAAAVVVAGMCYLMASRQPPNAGRPLPRIAVAALVAGSALPAHARVVAVPDYDQAWIHAWSVRATRYEDVYVPLRAPGQPPGAPVKVVMKASYIAGYETVQEDPPVAPFEGELANASYPAWMRARMAEHGFTLAPGAIELDRMKLNGREPGNDGVGAALAIGGGIVVVLICLLIVGIATYQIGADEALSDRRGRRR